jgi:hypothetical protein
VTANETAVIMSIVYHSTATIVNRFRFDALMCLLTARGISFIWYNDQNQGFEGSPTTRDEG